MEETQPTVASWLHERALVETEVSSRTRLFLGENDRQQLRRDNIELLRAWSFSLSLSLRLTCRNWKASEEVSLYTFRETRTRSRTHTGWENNLRLKQKCQLDTWWYSITSQQQKNMTFSKNITTVSHSVWVCVIKKKKKIQKHLIASCIIWQVRPQERKKIRKCKNEMPKGQNVLPIAQNSTQVCPITQLLIVHWDPLTQIQQRSF